MAKIAPAWGFCTVKLSTVQLPDLHSSTLVGEMTVFEIERAKLTKPNFSTPKTRTKYGKVINGNIIFTACNADNEKKFEAKFFLSLEALEYLLKKLPI